MLIKKSALSTPAYLASMIFTTIFWSSPASTQDVTPSNSEQTVSFTLDFTQPTLQQALAPAQAIGIVMQNYGPGEDPAFPLRLTGCGIETVDYTGSNDFQTIAPILPCAVAPGGLSSYSSLDYFGLGFSNFHVTQVDVTFYIDSNFLQYLIGYENLVYGPLYAPDVIADLHAIEFTAGSNVARLTADVPITAGGLQTASWTVPNGATFNALDMSVDAELDTFRSVAFINTTITGLYVPLFDFAISPLQISQTGATIGQDGLLQVSPQVPVMVNVPLTGTGLPTSGATDVTLLLQIDPGTPQQTSMSQLVSVATIESSAAGYTVPMSVTFSAAQAGVHTLIATVDPGNALGESNFTNNATSPVQIEVVTAARLMISNIQISQAVNNFNLSSSTNGFPPSRADSVSLVKNKSTVILATVTATGALSTDTSNVLVTATLPDGTSATGTLPLGVAIAPSNPGVSNTIALIPASLPQTGGQVSVNAKCLAITATCTNASAAPTVTKSENVYATSGLSIVYVPMQDTCSGTACAGYLGENPPLSHQTNSDLFIRETFPIANGYNVPNGGLTSAMACPQSGACAQPISNAVAPLSALALLGTPWLQIAQDFGTVWRTRISQNSTARNGVGVVPGGKNNLNLSGEGYFFSKGMPGRHGLTPSLSTNALSSPLFGQLVLLSAQVSLVEEGWWVATAHEIGHTFGIYGDSSTPNLPIQSNVGFNVQSMIPIPYLSPYHYDFMNNDIAYNNLNINWTTASDFGTIFKGLDPILQSDPQVIVLSGVVSALDGSVQLSPTFFLPNGTSTPFVESAGGVVSSVDSTGTVFSQASFLVPAQLQYLTDQNEAFAAPYAPFLIQVPLNSATASLNISVNGQVTATLNPFSQLLIDAIQAIPDSSFKRDPSKSRRDLLDQAQLIERQLKACQVSKKGQGIELKSNCLRRAVRLLLDLRERLEGDLNDSVETTSPLQLTKTAVLRTLDEVVLQTIPNLTVNGHNHAFELRILPQFGDRDDRREFTVASVTQGTDGSVVINRNGTVTYQPVGRGKEDRFSVTIRDAEGDTSIKTVTILAAPENCDRFDK